MKDVQDVLAGKTVPAVVRVPTLVLTEDLLKQGTDPNLQYVK